MYVAVSFKQKAAKIEYKYPAYLCVLYILHVNSVAESTLTRAVFHNLFWFMEQWN